MPKPKFDAILPCRVMGTRLYGKPLQLIDIDNRITILECLVKHIETSEYIEDIILAIADTKGNEVFLDVVKKNNWKYVLGDERDVLSRMIKASDVYNTKVIFHVSTECPFLYYKNLDRLFEKHVEGDYDFSNLSDLPEGSGYSIYKAEALRISHKKGTSRHRGEIVSAYIFDNQDEFKILTEEPDKKLRRPEVRITVDYPEDLVFCRKIYRALNGDKKLIEISAVIDFWDKNEEIRRPMEEIGIDWGHGRLWK